LLVHKNKKRKILLAVSQSATRSGLIGLAAVVALAGQAVPARALTFIYGTEFSDSGYTTSVSPFAKADIVDVVGGVSITISLSGALKPTEFVSAAYFNYGTTKYDVAKLDAAKITTGGTQSPPPTVDVGFNAYKAGPSGYYDLRLSFKTSESKRFIGGETSSVTFTLAGLSAALFNNLSTSTKDETKGPFYSVLRVQGLSLSLLDDDKYDKDKDHKDDDDDKKYGASGSGWFSPIPGGGGGGGQSEVPLPGAVILFGTVLAGSYGVGRWRRSRKRALPHLA
jgi:hypothetical protein